MMVKFGKVYYGRPENAARRYRDDEELSSQQLTRRYSVPVVALSIKEQAEQFELEHPIMGILG